MVNVKYINKLVSTIGYAKAAACIQAHYDADRLTEQDGRAVMAHLRRAYLREYGTISLGMTAQLSLR